MSGPYEPNQPGQPQSPPPWDAARPYQGPQPQPFQDPAAAPKKRSWFARHKVLTVVLAIVAVAVVLGGIGAAVGGGSGGKDSAAVTSPSATDSGEPGLGTPDGIQDTTPPAPPVAAYTPTAKDFTIALKIKSKECFGDAGCNVTYEPRLTIVGAQVDQTASYEVTYEVRGGQDGAAVDTIELDNGQYSANEGLAQTARQSSKLTAVITSVETN